MGQMCVRVVLVSRYFILNTNNSHVFCPMAVSQNSETNKVIDSVNVFKCLDF